VNIPKLGRVSARAALATSAARIVASEARIAPSIGFIEHWPQTLKHHLSRTAVLALLTAVLAV